MDVLDADASRLEKVFDRGLERVWIVRWHAQERIALVHRVVLDSLAKLVLVSLAQTISWVLQRSLLGIQAPDQS